MADNDKEYQEWLKTHKVGKDAPDTVDQIRMANGGQPRLLQKPEGRINPKLQPTTKEALGMLANMANTGVAGAEMGAMTPIPGGALMGGLAGLGAGAYMDPASEPMTDLGGFAGMMASKMLPGGPLMKGALTGGATALSSYIGSIGDKKADYISETPWGKIALFSGINSVAAGQAEKMKAMMAPTKTFTATEAMRDAFGVEIPLNVGESVSSPTMQKFTKFITQGSTAAHDLAGRQSEAETAILEKVFGKVLGRDGFQKVDSAITQTRQVARNAWDDFKIKNRQQIPTGAEDTGLMDAYDRPITRPTFELKNPSGNDFAKAFGLAPGEKEMFFSLIRRNPESFVNYFMPSGQTDAKGLLGMRGLLKVLPEQEVGRLSSAIIARLMEKGGAVVNTPQGSYLSGEGMYNALFNKFGKDRLLIMFGKDRVNALEQFADIMRTADAAEKAGVSTTAADAPLRYLSNKAVFNIFSTTAIGAAGGAVSPMTIAGPLAGGAVGFGMAVPMFSMLARVMSNPEFGKLLVASGKHMNGKAASALARVLVTPKDEKEVAEPNSTPATRMNGLLGR